MRRVLLAAFLSMAAVFLQAQELDSLYDPQSIRQLSKLLSDPIVARAVGVDPSELHALRKKQNELTQQNTSELQKVRESVAGRNLPELSLALAEARRRSSQLNESLAGVLDEVMSPTQVKRLREIAYRGEINKRGFEYALIESSLGAALGIQEGEKPALSTKVRRLESELETKLAKLKEEHERAVLNELTQEQRDKAVELLGERFDYVPKSPEEVALEIMRKFRKTTINP